MRRLIISMSVLFASSAVLAETCEENFTKSGNPFKGTSYNSYLTVPNLTMKDAMGQIRGIMIAEKMDVITEDLEGGSMLVEQRSTSIKRAIPTIINFSNEGTSAKIDMTIKTEKGVLAKQEDIKVMMCKLFAQVKSGKEGKTAAAKGSKTQNNNDATKKDVFSFSREIANEANKNAVAVNARHKGRVYTLKGKVDNVMEDGQEYNVSFDIPEVSEMAIQPFPGQAQFRVGVACLFKQNQLANVLTFRKGYSVSFTGSFYRYDDNRRMVWLENCKPSK
jgi:hypothetical protein